MTMPTMEAQRDDGRELRFFDKNDLGGLELRAATDSSEGTERRLVGLGAVYDKLSVDLGGFRELFKQNTFTESIENDDIRSLRDHNSTYILGRNTAGTLVLSEDKRGVSYDVAVPDTSYGRDLVVSVERGDVTGCSIIFSVEEERWYVDGNETEFIDALMAMWDEKKHKVERHVSKGRLYDIGPVTFPAYPQTRVKARGLAVAGIDYERLGAAVVRHKRGLDLSDNDREMLAKAGDIIRGCLADPGGADGRGVLKARSTGLEKQRFNLR